MFALQNYNLAMRAGWKHLGSVCVGLKCWVFEGVSTFSVNNYGNNAFVNFQSNNIRSKSSAQCVEE